MKQAFDLELAKNTLISPTKAFELINKKQSFFYGLIIYFLYVAASFFCYKLMPDGFFAKLKIGQLISLPLISKALASGLLMAVLLSIFISIFSYLVKRFSIILFIFLSAVFLSAPLVFTFTASLKTSLAFLLIFTFAAGFLFVKNRKFPSIKIISLLLISNLIALALIPFQFAASILNSEKLYIFSELIAGFWIIYFLARGVKFFLEISTAKIFAVLIMSVLTTMEFIFIFYKLNIISGQTLKILAVF